MGNDNNDASIRFACMTPAYQPLYLLAGKGIYSKQPWICMREMCQVHFYVDFNWLSWLMRKKTVLKIARSDFRHCCSTIITANTFRDVSLSFAVVQMCLSVMSTRLSELQPSFTRNRGKPGGMGIIFRLTKHYGYILDTGYGTHMQMLEPHMVVFEFYQ